MEITNIEVSGMEAALRGMRNPMNSWSKSTPEADVELGRKLSSAGPAHCKFLRMIAITCDITAPLYWWKEFDTYKVGTVANSCSTMHTLTDRKLKLDDFETEGINLKKSCLLWLIDILNDRIEEYKANPKNNTEIWRTLIAMLPSCYLQKRTVMLNYEVLRRIVKDRTGHKLKEWKYFIEAMSALPYYTEFILGKTGEECMKESVKKSFNNFARDISNSKKIDTLYEEAIKNMTNETRQRMTDESVKALAKEIEESKHYVGEKKDPINPSHYKDHSSIECIDAMMLACGVDAVYAFCICNAYKYLWRHKYKNGVEDLDKARWYIHTAAQLAVDYPDLVEYEECGEILSRMIDKYDSKLDET